MMALFGLITSCQQRENSLRIMSYNIRNLRGIDDVRDVGRVAKVINEAKPDVVAVQEVDSVTGRSEQTDVLGLLATETQMHPTYAAAIDYDGGKYGVGILSREKPLSHHSLPLPGREEQRVLLVVEFDRYLFACTHLSLTEEDRLRSLPLLNQGQPRRTNHSSSQETGTPHPIPPSSGSCVNLSRCSVIQDS